MENAQKLQFDFSKIEDQKKFNKLPQELKTSIIEKAYEEANIIKTMVDSGAAKDYTDAQNKITESSFSEHNFSIILANDGNVYLDIGGGRSLIGCSYEGVFSDDGHSADLSRMEENMRKILSDIDLLIGNPSGNA